MMKRSLYVLFQSYLYSSQILFWGTSGNHDPSQRLQHHFIKELDPEKMTIIFDEEPDESGYIQDIYMNLEGAIIVVFELTISL